LDDPRLQPPGAVFDEENGRLKDSAYKDLVEEFARELPSDQHPDPYSPGLAADEFAPEGVRVWDDARGWEKSRQGAGWIAVHVIRTDESQTRPVEKWFNVSTWGSWRLAFLLARLQRRIWECQAGLASINDSLECRLVKVDGICHTPKSLQNTAHAVAQALRSRSSGGFLGLTLAEDAPREDAGDTTPPARPAKRRKA
jgi:hypothetical protein